MSLAEARSKGLTILKGLHEGNDPSADRKQKKNQVEPLVGLVADYLKETASSLRPGTLRVYKPATQLFLAWAASVHVRIASELTPELLFSLRAYLISLPRRKGKGKRRSGITVNVELRAIFTMLNLWRRKGHLPALNSDSLSDGLARAKEDQDEPVCLRPSSMRSLLEAAQRHDVATFVETRKEHAGAGQPGGTPRYCAIAPFAALLLLLGMRRGELLCLRWDRVQLDDGEIVLRKEDTKTRRGRTIGLEVSPFARKLLGAMRLRAGEATYVFEGYSAPILDTARQRLTREFGAPRFTWKGLRSTCATYLCSSTEIFGSATIHMSSKQLGHSVTVSERCYAKNALRGLPKGATTLDAAMELESVLAEILRRFLQSAILVRARRSVKGRG
jgi:integrase